MRQRLSGLLAAAIRVLTRVSAPSNTARSETNDQLEDGSYGTISLTGGFLIN